MDALNGQMDIIEVIKQLRISAFHQKIDLSRNQAELVQYFSAFSLDHLKTGDVSQEQDIFGAEIEVMEILELLRHFNPGEGNRIDSMLLYEITGREIDSCMKDWKKDSFGAAEWYEGFAPSSPLLAQELNDEAGEYGIQ